MDDDLSPAILAIDQDELSPIPQLDLSHLPPIYVLTAHLSIEEQHEAEDALSSRGAPLTYDVKEANIVLGKISKKKRAKFELQWRGVQTEEIEKEEILQCSSTPILSGERVPAIKRKRLGDGKEASSDMLVNVVAEDSSTASETEDGEDANTKPMSQLSLSRISTSSTMSSPSNVESQETSPQTPLVESFTDKVKVLKMDWLYDSLSVGRFQSFEGYVIYEARKLPLERATVHPPVIEKACESKLFTRKPSWVTNEGTGAQVGTTQSTRNLANDNPRFRFNKFMKRDRAKDAVKPGYVDKKSSSFTPTATKSHGQSITRPTHLLHQTTSEHDEVVSSAIPPMPDWVRENRIYSCERATPMNPPNRAFISQLEKIKLARILTLDEIGVRAYSTSIASLAAYPYPIQSTREILALPGCDQKIAHLFHEYQTTNGKIGAVTELENNPELKVLRDFYEIWGVGAKTAQEFYHDNGWRDLDDIVENGWKSLSRVQQIGLKYYDEFLLKISRSEVESIAATISKHASLVTDADIETIIVGGYRRGKTESGDVDVILSHRHQAMTYDLVEKVVKSLEKNEDGEGGWITHTLILNLTNTKRDQETLPIQAATLSGRGFDTLDKALVVWQDPHWPTKAADLASNPNFKNPNPHRRVDIIISPWRTVGCAVAGWTSGTTFQRDLRRYAKKVKGWKFDSSGVRERGTGRWVDLERWTDEKTRCSGWREAERRVFEGLGLTYREPGDRCTD